MVDGYKIDPSNAISGQVLAYNGTSFIPTTPNTSFISSLTASSPLTGGVITSTGTIGIPKASGSADGYLLAADWTTFNNKQAAGSYALTSTIISTTSPITGGGDLSTSRTFAIPQASSSVDGYLSQADWTTFNSKQAAGSYALQSITLTANAPITGGGDLSTNRSFSMAKANGSTDGYLAQGDWTTFNNKISANQTITLSGDISGSGSTAITTTIGATKVTNAMLAGSIVASSKLSATGTPSSTTYLRGDDTWATVTAGLTGTFSNNQVTYGNSANSTLQASANLTFDGTTLTAKHITGVGAPTIAIGSVTQLGTSPSASIVSATDQGGTIRITSGTSCDQIVAGTGYAFATITFNTTWAAAPKSILMQVANSAAIGKNLSVYATSIGTTSFVITVYSSIGTSPTLANSTAYDFQYIVIG